MDIINDDGEMDVTSVTSISSDGDPALTLKSNLSKLCSLTIEVRKFICSALGKTGLSQVTPSQIIGRGSTKVSKEYLADNLIKIAKLAETIEPIVNADSPSVNFVRTSESVSNVHNFEEYLTSLQARLEYYDT